MRVNNRKWISRVFVMLFMVIATIGIAYAETPENYTEGYYTYTLDADGNATITEYLGNEENIVVPSMLGGHKVVEINAGESAPKSVFMEKSVVKTITIPDGVTTLEDSAFANNPNLVAVTLPSTIQHFGQFMFSGDFLLENIFVSNDSSYVYDIDGALYAVSTYGPVLHWYPQNKSATSFIVPNGVESIMPGAFTDNKKLNKIVIPVSVRNIFKNAFPRIKNAVSIYVNSTDIEFDYRCFFNLAQGSKIYVKNAEIVSKLSGCYSADTTTVVDLSSLSDEEIKDVTTPATSIELKNSTDEHLIVNYDVKINLNNRYSVAPADTTDAVTWTSCVLDPVTGEPTGTEQPVDSAKAYGPGKPQYVRLTATTDSGKSIAMYVRYQKDLKECTANDSNIRYIYDSTEKKAALTVKDGQETLTEDVDYTVTYSGNTNAGTASYTIAGIGTYKGGISREFTIEKPSLDNTYSTCVISLDNISYTYDGTEKKPAVTVVANGRTLIKDTDYTLEYQNCINAGVATVVVQGINNYWDKGTMTYDILPGTGGGGGNDGGGGETPGQADISSATVTLPQYGYVCINNSIRPEPVVVLNGVTLVANMDYLVTYAGNMAPGTATITIIGTGKYTGFAYVNFTITQAAGGNNGGGTPGGGNNGGGNNGGGTSGGGTSGGGTSTPDTNTPAGNEPADKITNVSDTYTKYYGDKAFTLKAKGNGKITYSSNNKKVVTVDKSKGKVTIKGTGSAVITVKSSDASRKVIINVAPKKNAISKLSAGKKYFKVSYKKDTKATGYQICYSTSKSFKGSKTDTVKNSKTTSKTIKKLKSGKTTMCG